MELSLDVQAVTLAQAVDGMRRPFMRAFGVSWVGRRLAACAWPAFSAALLHGSGIAVARSHAQVAAEERNGRTMLVARWTSRRIDHVVDQAVQRAANAA
ncbi:MAG: hypothetical protein WCD35_08175 [Mycobacteriales bacterium]